MSPRGREDRIRFGIDVTNFGDYAEPRNVIRLARTAEAAGWEGLFIWDHLAFSWGLPSADPWITLAAVATATERLRLGPMVSPLARYRPAVLAHALVTFDRLSGGRTVLGVGLGGVAREYLAFGESADPRKHAAIVDEALA